MQNKVYIYKIKYKKLHDFVVEFGKIRKVFISLKKFFIAFLIFIKILWMENIMFNWIERIFKQENVNHLKIPYINLNLKKMIILW